ncbi:hypothetical protein OIU76_029614 [Salix suchowensis]|nr:hypothetical protein OIU76_029614 [Salix suchowensis]
MPIKDAVSWNTILDGGLAKDAMRSFEQMEEAGLKPDDGTVISILASCAESGLLGLGKRVHTSIERIRYKCSVNVSNALIDMYAKCGQVDRALSVFNGMLKQDLVSWNCMLQGLAMHGHVLCACVHAGFVDKGIQYFNNMERDYGIVPHIEHYGCMVDLLGRGGRLKEAFRFVQSMPVEPNVVIWGTLLGACRLHNAAGLAEEVLDYLVKLEPSDPGNYSLLSNIFASVGDWSNVANVRLQMKNFGIQKPSGASSIEVDDEVHEFTVFDKSHPKSDKIYRMINRLDLDLKRVHVVPKVYL